MKVAVVYGNARKGNTYKAAQIFKDELSKHTEVDYVDFTMPTDLPELYTGCQLCLGNEYGKCPHSKNVMPIIDAILGADALIVATPHCGASTMPASMKNFLDHLDFLAMTVAPRIEIFKKKAFIITTGTGSTGAIGTIAKGLRHWGFNRVYGLGLRMFTDKWNKMPEKKQRKCEYRLSKAAGRFYQSKQRKPYLKTVLLYHMNKFIIKRYVGEGAYPYEHWRKNGWFEKRPF